MDASSASTRTEKATSTAAGDAGSANAARHAAITASLNTSSRPALLKALRAVHSAHTRTYASNTRTPPSGVCFCFRSSTIADDRELPRDHNHHGFGDRVTARGGSE